MSETPPDYCLALQLELLLSAHGKSGNVVPINIPTVCQQLACSIEELAAAFEELTRQGVVSGLVPLPPDSDSTIHFKN